MARIGNSVRKLYTSGITLMLCLGAGWLAWFLLDPLINGPLRIKSYSGIVSLVVGSGLACYVVFEIWKFIVPRKRKKTSSEYKSELAEQSNQEKENSLL